MKQIFLRLALLALLPASLLQASAITGAVTNKTTGKPSAGDKVALVDLSAGMKDVVTVRTDAKGRYTFTPPGQGPYLIRADHQGGSYYIAAPKEGAEGDIGVYDVAAKVDGVALEADAFQCEARNGVLRTQERFYIRNASQPPRAQFSDKTFEFSLPEGTVLDGAAAMRPGGMATNIQPVKLGQGRYTINVPIQPSQGDRLTVFELQYHFAYSGKQKFSLKPLMASDELVVLLAKGMSFGGSSGAAFRTDTQDPQVLAYFTKNVAAGQAISFTVSGEGEMSRDNAAAGAQQSAAGGDSGASSQASPAPAAPGGGIGNPMAAPDSLSKYKLWIIFGLVLILAGVAGYYLRKQPPSSAQSGAPGGPLAPGSAAPSASGNLLEIVKEELFQLESDKLSGAISDEEYAQAKVGLEALMKRALQQNR